MIRKKNACKSMEIRQIDFFNILSALEVVNDDDRSSPSASRNVSEPATRLHNLVHGFSTSVPADRVAELTGSSPIPLRSMRVPLHAGLIPGWAPNGYGKTFVFGQLLKLISLASQGDADPVARWERYWDLSTSAIQSTLGDVAPFSMMGLRILDEQQAFDVLVCPPSVTASGTSLRCFIRRNTAKHHFSDHVWSYTPDEQWDEIVLVLDGSTATPLDPQVELITQIFEAFFAIHVDYIETPKLSSSDFNEFIQDVEIQLNDHDEITRQHWAMESVRWNFLDQLEDICLESHNVQNKFYSTNDETLRVHLEEMRERMKQLESCMASELGDDVAFADYIDLITQYWMRLEPLLFQIKTHPSSWFTFALFEELLEVFDRVIQDHSSRETMMVMRRLNELHALALILERNHEDDVALAKIDGVLMTVFSLWNQDRADPVSSYLVYRCLLVMDSTDLAPMLGTSSKINLDDTFNQIFELVNSQNLHESWPWSSSGSVLLNWRFEALEESLREPFDLENVLERPYFSIPSVRSNESGSVFLTPKNIDQLKRGLRLWPRTDVGMLPEVKPTLAAINRLLAEEGDPWSVTCRLMQSSSGELQFLFHPTDQPGDSIDRPHLSFGIRSEVVFRLSLMRFLHEAKNQSMVMQEDMNHRKILVFDEPEVGRSEYWTACLIEGLNEIDDDFEGSMDASVFVISHRSLVSDHARRDGFSHNMHVDVGDEEE